MDFETTKIALPDEPEYLKQPITLFAGKCYYLGEFFGVSRRDNLGAFIGSAAGAMTANQAFPSGVDRNRIQVVGLKFMASVVGIKQDFTPTTAELKKSMPGLSDLTFESAWDY